MEAGLLRSTSHSLAESLPSQYFSSYRVESSSHVGGGRGDRGMPLYYLGAWGRLDGSVVSAGTRAFLLKSHD